MTAGERRWSASELRALYVESRQLARSVLRTRDNHSWSPSVLVNEAFRRLLAGDWADRVRADPRSVLPALRTVMRRAIADHDDETRAAKRPLGEGRTRIAYDDTVTLLEHDADAFVDLLGRLEALRAGTAPGIRVSDPAKCAEAIELALIVGLSTREIAETVGVSQRTAANWVRIGIQWLDDDGA